MEPDKLKAVFYGKRSENLACLMLRIKGYRIIARNMRTPVGEIDIIAKRANTLCFIEVKARQSLINAQQALSLHQQKRIIRAAQTFLSSNPRYCDYTFRFDFIAIAPWQWPRHLENAWQAL